jgi:uncharacterized protein Veg
MRADNLLAGILLALIIISSASASGLNETAEPAPAEPQQAAGLGIFNMSYAERVYQHSNQSFSFNTGSYTGNRSLVLRIGETIHEPGNQSFFSLLLNTDSVGNHRIDVILMLDNETLHNASYEYEVTDDWDNDGYQPIWLGGSDCNDTNPLVNPGQQEILNNGLDDDCNPATPDEQILITPSKQRYRLSESISLTIDAPEEASVHLSVYNTATNTVAYQNAISGSFPKTIKLTGITKQGNYSINIEEDGFLEEVSGFEVYNSISADISAFPDELWMKEEVVFTAKNAEGGFSPYKYEWKLGDGKTGEGKEIKHTYTKSGAFTASLTVTDSQGNKKAFQKAISLEGTYPVTFTVKDKESKKALSGIQVFVEGYTHTTNSNGQAVFNIPKGEFTAKVFDPYYEAAHFDFEVKAKSSYTLEITKLFIDETPPRITLLAPADEEVVQKGIVSFEFRGKDQSPFSCELMLTSDGVWWESRLKLELIENNTQKSVSLDNFVEGDYRWRLSCEDELGNRGDSEAWDFSVFIGPNDKAYAEYLDRLEEIKNQSQSGIAEVEALLQSSLGLPPLAKEVAELLGWQTSLNFVKNKLVYLERDSFNVRYRKDNWTGKLELANNYSIEAGALYDGLIRHIEVDSKDTKIFYPDEAEVDIIIKGFLEAQGYPEGRFNLNPYILRNRAAQTNLKVTTAFYHVRIEHMSGEEHEYTLVQRQIAGNVSMKEFLLLLHFPKHIVEKASDVEFITPHTVLLEDPLIEVIPEGGQVVYMLPGHKSFEVLEASHLLILERDIVLEAGTKVTGLSFFDLLHISDRSGLYFLGTLIAVVLLGYYLLVSVGVINRLLCRVKGKPDYDLHDKIRGLIIEAREQLEQNSVSQAVVVFKEIEVFYSRLSERGKTQTIEEICKLASEINVAKISRLITNAVYLNENSRKPEAREVFNEILTFYAGLQDRAKLELEQRLNALKEAIAGEYGQQTHLCCGRPACSALHIVLISDIHCEGLCGVCSA